MKVAARAPPHPEGRGGGRMDGVPIFYEVSGRYAFIYAFIISTATSLIVAIMATRITK